MADTLVEVVAAGGSPGAGYSARYTTIQGAVNAADVTGGRYIIDVNDTSAYDEAVTISGVTGTPSITNYVWLRGGAGFRHSGVAGTGHARLIPDTASGHGITISTAYTRVSHLEIKQQSPGASDEAIRVSAGGDNALIHDCILWTAVNVQDTDGIYTGNWSVGPIFVDHCIIYGWARAGIHAQAYSGTSTQDWFVDHCAFYDIGGTSSVTQAAIKIASTNGGDSIDMTVHNTWASNNVQDFEDGLNASFPTAPAGTVTWNGSHNITQRALTEIDGTNNLTNHTLVANGATDTDQSGTWILVNDLTAGAENLLLAAATTATNAPVDAGTDRTGSEPDSRQDFSTDIEGETRSGTFDVGADEVVSAGSGVSADGTATAGPATVSGTASVDVQADGTATSAAGQASGTAAVDVDADGTTTAGPATVSGTAAVVAAADGTATSGPGALDGTAQLGSARTADGTTAAGPATASGTATVAVQGDGAASSAPATADAVGSVAVQGDGTATSGPAVVSGTASLPTGGRSADGAATSSPPVAAGTAAVDVQADGTTAGSAADVDATAAVLAAADAIVAAAAAELDGTAAVAVTADGTATAGPAVVSGSTAPVVPVVASRATATASTPTSSATAGRGSTLTVTPEGNR